MRSSYSGLAREEVACQWRRWNGPLGVQGIGLRGRFRIYNPSLFFRARNNESNAFISDRVNYTSIALRRLDFAGISTTFEL